MNWKVTLAAMLLLPLPFLAGGCGGIAATGTVSPATFFLPGLLRNDTAPATNAPSALPETSSSLASAN